MRTTWGGLPSLADHVPEEDGSVAARLKAAGAILLGKTSGPEIWPDSIFARTNNPWELAHTRRRNRMSRRFQRVRVVVFGRSHIPWLEDEEGLLLLNPGSPVDRRRQPEHTFALLWMEGGEVCAEVLAI